MVYQYELIAFGRLEHRNGERVAIVKDLETGKICHFSERRFYNLFDYIHIPE